MYINLPPKFRKLKEFMILCYWKMLVFQRSKYLFVKYNLFNRNHFLKTFCLNASISKFKFVNCPAWLQCQSLKICLSQILITVQLGHFLMVSKIFS